MLTKHSNQGHRQTFQHVSIQREWSESQEMGPYTNQDPKSKTEVSERSYATIAKRLNTSVGEKIGKAP